MAVEIIYEKSANLSDTGSVKKGKSMPGREIAKGKPNLSRMGFKDFQNNKTRGHSRRQCTVDSGLEHVAHISSRIQPQRLRFTRTRRTL